ncbi:MAG: insulinase family protein [Ignavibacteriae bacterium]|nr:insulinase family protein [Ignavibacteriota bacterium]
MACPRSSSTRNLYPDDHPYHWPTIGSMEDLSAASFDDVVHFFKNSGPNNASLSVGGDIDPVKTRALSEKWFSDIPAGPPVPPPGAPVAFLGTEKRLVLEDKVQLPRLYMAWHSPAIFTPGDAEWISWRTFSPAGRTPGSTNARVRTPDRAGRERVSGLGPPRFQPFQIVSTPRAATRWPKWRK